MTLILPRRHLVDAVAQAAHGDHVRLELQPSSLVVLGADMWTLICIELSVDARPAPVAVTLPTDLLVKTLKACQGDDVAVELTSTRLRLRSGGYGGEVAAQGRLPQMQEVPDEMWQTLSCDQATRLGQALRSAAVAALSDPARPTVSGVRVDVASDVVYVVGTDGARLHCVELRDVVVGESLTLPVQCVGAVCAALDEVEIKPAVKSKRTKGAAVAVVAVSTAAPPVVRLAVGSNNLAVEVVTPQQHRLVFCRRAPEPYSEWRRVAVTTAKPQVTLTLQRDVWLAALKSCPADAVTLRVIAGSLQIDYVVLDDTTTRRLGEGSVTVAVLSCEAARDVTVKVSTALLRDAVAQCGDVVEMSMSSSQPVRLRSGNFSAVVMFVR